MLIDWFTVGAQLLNFLVLVWLLKRFLYRPVIDAVDARERHVRESLERAGAKEREAEQKGEEYNAKLADLERERGETLRRASEEAEQSKIRLVAEARQEAERRRREFLEAIEAERRTLARQVRERVRADVLETVRSILADLAGTSLDQRMVEVMAERIEKLDEAGRATFAEALSSHGLTVRSSSDLPEESRRRLETALGRVLPVPASLEYELDPSLLAGLEVGSGGVSVSWSAAVRLEDLERRLSTAGARSDRPATRKKGDTLVGHSPEDSRDR